MVKFLMTTIIMLLAGILTCLVFLIISENRHPSPVNMKEVAPVRKLYNVSYSNQNLSCLSEAIFNEAGTEPMIGKEAVGIVIMNRAEQKGTQNICSIVHESRVVNGVRICQFSYYCLPANRRLAPTSGTNWAESVFIAVKILNNKLNDGAELLVANATHFHADYVHPAWTRDMKFLSKIGTHLFYAEENQNEKVLTIGSN